MTRMLSTLSRISIVTNTVTPHACKVVMQRLSSQPRVWQFTHIA